jgi:hypothetical protein
MRRQWGGDGVAYAAAAAGCVAALAVTTTARQAKGGTRRAQRPPPLQESSRENASLQPPSSPRHGPWRATMSAAPPPGRSHRSKQTQSSVLHAPLPFRNPCAARQAISERHSSKIPAPAARNVSGSVVKPPHMRLAHAGTAGLRTEYARLTFVVLSFTRATDTGDQKVAYPRYGRLFACPRQLSVLPPNELNPAIYRAWRGFVPSVILTKR